MRHRHTLAAALTAAMTVFGSAACSAGADAARPRSSPPPSATAAIILATQKTDEYLSVTIHTSSNGYGGLTTTSGSVNRRPYAVDLRYQVSDLPAMQTVFIDGVLYQAYPGGLGAHWGYKHWVRTVVFGPGAAKEDSGAGYLVLGLDPWTQLKTLTWARSVQRVGQETVGGVPTWHYRGLLDPADLPSSAASADPAAAPSAAPGGLTETLDAWIGADSLPVRIVMTVRTGSDAMRVRIDCSGYSLSQAAIAAPSASDTITEAQFLSG